ncbi:alpha/beta fold hydrolase [Nocardioides limicola]|uniref:alpha/beta fold hydrolase n=1 Tax=Nocardioides limicola TaxID=2803368 RepID=UPI00193B3D76|nr:alpha/beta fold hydrolase [Nocardioides sp. DJM-14]
MKLHHEIAGPTAGPAIVCVGSLGTTLEMWRPQIDALSPDFRVVAVDLPGHGGTQIPDQPPTVASYAATVADLMVALGHTRFGVVGLSFGGAVAQVLAADHAAHVTAAVVACTAPSFDTGFWTDRAAAVRRDGLGPVVEATALRRFSADFTARAPEAAAASLKQLAAMDPEGYAVTCEALGSFAEPVADRIRVPVQLVAGSADQVTPPHLADRLLELIPEARLDLLDGAGHLASLEQPRAFTALVRAHFG